MRPLRVALSLVGFSMTAALPAATPALAIDPELLPWDRTGRVVSTDLPSLTGPNEQPRQQTANNIKGDNLKADSLDGLSAAKAVGTHVQTARANRANTELDLSDPQPGTQAPARSTTATPGKTVVAAKSDVTKSDDPSLIDPATDDPNAIDRTPAATPEPPPTPQAPPVEAVAPPPPPADPLTMTIRQYAVTNAATALKDYDQNEVRALAEFYGAHGGAPLWINDKGFTDGAKSVIAEFARAADWGLDPSAYNAPVITPANGQSATPEELAGADLRLSLAVLRYARDARGGRIPDPTTMLSSYLDRKPQVLDPKIVLDGIDKATDKSAYLHGLNPKHPEFEKLRQKLLELRSAKTETEQLRVPDGPRIKLGTKHPNVAVVRKRLNVALPASASGAPVDDTVYDKALFDAVVAFQEANDLKVNGQINAQTRNALNRSDRVDESVLLANMEEWRWMPENLGPTHIFVNIPEFTVKVVKDNAIIHEERVVTGELSKQTPIFSEAMKTIVLWPYWIVPNSIKVNELWPRIAGGGDPIAGRGLRLMRNGKPIDTYTVDWSRSDIRNYDVVQPPGPANVLGQVKFLFPNKHAVYLHDTPSKGLFNEASRTFSHGCIRVRNPIRLAEVLFGVDKSWSPEQVAQLLKDGPEDNQVPLATPIPVHVTYFTAWVDDQGKLQTRRDIYGHEQRLKLALAGKWNQIEKNRDHLLPSEPVKVARYRQDDGYGWGNGFFWYGDDDRPAYKQGQKRGYAKRQKGVGDYINEALGGF